jgi:hypothetical protein
MPNWKKVITSGSQAQLAGVTGSFTGSFIGDGSGLTGISAGYATTGSNTFVGSQTIHQQADTTISGLVLRNTGGTQRRVYVNGANDFVVTTAGTPQFSISNTGAISGSSLDIASSGSFGQKVQAQGFRFGPNLIGSLGAGNRYISDGGDAQDFWFNVPVSGRYRFAINDVVIGGFASNGQFSAKGGLDITGHITSSGDIRIAGDAYVAGTISGSGLDIAGAADINGNTTITGSLNIYKSGSTVFTIEGSQGTLFSVTDQLSGSLFSVNDISGIPIFEVFSDDTVKIGTFNSEAIIVNGTSAVITGSFTGSFVGDGSNLTGIFTLANDTNNRIITATGTNSGNGESNFTYDGTTATIAGGNVDIGKSLAVGGITPSGTTGRIDASNDIVAYSSSDKRWKTNIKIIESPLEKLQKLSGVEFDWIEDSKLHGNSGNDVGVIAQEVELVLPQAVQTRDTGMKAVRYEKIIPLLIETIKEQQKQIDELKNKIG